MGGAHAVVQHLVINSEQLFRGLSELYKTTLIPAVLMKFSEPVGQLVELFSEPAEQFVEFLSTIVTKTKCLEVRIIYNKIYQNKYKKCYRNNLRDTEIAEL